MTLNEELETLAKEFENNMRVNNEEERNLTNVEIQQENTKIGTEEDNIIENMEVNVLEQNNVIKSEIQENLEIVETQWNIPEEVRKYQVILANNSFFIENEKLVYETSRGIKRISNFIPVITKKVVITNGTDEEIKYNVKCILIKDGTELEEMEITKEQLNNFKFIIGSNSNWDKKAIVINGGHSYLREVAQLVSENTIQEKTIISNTGFERIGENLVYMCHHGKIGNTSKEIEADLSAEGLEQYYFTNKEFDVKEALNTSFSIMKLADKSITIPLLGLTYISPLISLYRENDILCDTAVFIVGRTGTRKSSTASIMLNHFANTTRNSFGLSFRDTANAIEKKVYVLKDTLVIIDDFCPEQTGDKTDVLEKVLAMFGDRVGRARMKTNGIGTRKAYTARGCAIITGEYIPNIAESRLARTLIINIEKDSINLDVLTELQKNKEKLSFAMINYIKFIIQNESHIIEESKEMFFKLQNQKNNSFHGRTNEAINCIYLGFYWFLEFLLKNEVIKEQEKENLKKEGYATLLKVAESQAEEIGETNPINMFYSGFNTLLKTERINLLDYETGQPINSKGVKVGYIDTKKNRLYLYSEAVYSEISKYYHITGRKFPISKKMLLKAMKQDNILIGTKDNHMEVKRTNPNIKKKESVIDILAKLDGDI